MVEPRCLCSRCLSDYIRAGYIVKRVYSVTVKDDCEKCNKTGWTYIIKAKHKDGRSEVTPFR